MREKGRARCWLCPLTSSTASGVAMMKERERNE